MITGVPTWIKLEPFHRVVKVLKSRGLDFDTMSETDIKITYEELHKNFNESFVVGSIVMFNKPIEDSDLINKDFSQPIIIFNIGIVKEIKDQIVVIRFSESKNIEIDKVAVQRIILSQEKSVDNPDYDSSANIKFPSDYKETSNEAGSIS
jgi:hypothetical protein